MHSNNYFFIFQKNIGTVDTHVSDYQRMIDSLQVRSLLDSCEACGSAKSSYSLLLYLVVH